MKTTFVLALAAVTSLACHRTNDGFKGDQGRLSGPPRPAYVAPANPAMAGKAASPTYRLNPVDMTTRFGAGRLQLWFNSGGEPLDPVVLEAARNRLSLVTWPEMAQVATTSTVENANPKEGRHSARITLAPQEALGDRWYALKVTGEIPGVVLASDPGNAVIGPDGSHLARFKVGSELRLVSVVQREESRGTFSVTFAYSEPINADDQEVGKRITVNGVAPDCPIVKEAGNVRGSHVTFTCKKSLLADAQHIAYVPLPDSGAAALRMSLGGDRAPIRLVDGTEYVKLE